jgi:hypothetical protein
MSLGLELVGGSCDGEIRGAPGSRLQIRVLVTLEIPAALAEHWEFYFWVFGIVGEGASIEFFPTCDVSCLTELSGLPVDVCVGEVPSDPPRESMLLPGQEPGTHWAPARTTCLDSTWG